MSTTSVLPHGNTWKPLKIFFSKTAQQNFEILSPNSPYICVAKQCSIKYDHSKFFT